MKKTVKVILLLAGSLGAQPSLGFDNRNVFHFMVAESSRENGKDNRGGFWGDQNKKNSETRSEKKSSGDVKGKRDDETTP